MSSLLVVGLEKISNEIAKGRLILEKVDPVLQLEDNSNLSGTWGYGPPYPLLGASLNCRLCFFPRDLRGPASCSLSFGVTFLFSPVYRLSSFFVRDVRDFVSFSLVFTFSFSLMFFHLGFAVFLFS